MTMPLEELARLAPELAAHFTAPGGFDSPVLAAQYADARRWGLAAEALARLGGRDGARLGLVAPRSVAERMARCGALDRFPLLAVFCPESAAPGPLDSFTPGEIVAHPLAALASRRLDGVVNLAPGLALPVDRTPLVEVPPDVFLSGSPGEAEALFLHKRRAIAAREKRIAAVFKPGRTALFTGVTEYFHQMRISSVLRRMGMTTICLTLTSNLQRHKEEHFDLLVDGLGNLDVFYALLNSFPYRLVHFQAWMEQHHFAAAAAALCRNPCVIEFNDIPHLFLAPGDYDLVFGAGHFAREDQAIRHILRHADAVLTNNEPGACADLFAALEPDARPPLAAFHCYPLQRYFREAAEYDPYSLVSPTTVIPSNFPGLAFGDAHVMELARRYVIPQGLSLHVYCNPMNQSRDSPQIWDYRVYADSEPLFHLHEGLPPGKLAEAISGCGFGSMCYLMDGVRVQGAHLDAIVPSKAFTLAEAGLPILISEQFGHLGRWLESCGAGVVVRRQDLEQGLRRLIDRLDIPALRRGMRAFRQDNCMENRIHDLLEVYSRATGADMHRLASRADAGLPEPPQG